MALKFADEFLKKDKEIVLEAVRSDGMALEFADDSLKKDKEIINLAVQNNNKSIIYSDIILKKDKDFIMELLEKETYEKGDERFVPLVYKENYNSAFKSIFRKIDKDLINNSQILEVFKKKHKTSNDTINYLKNSEYILRDLKTSAEKSADFLEDGISKIIKKHNLKLNEIEEIRPIFDDIQYVLRLDDLILESINKS